MEQPVDLFKITDVNELKVLKADQYDRLEALNAETQQVRNNIGAINNRISQVVATAPKEPEKSASKA